MKTFKHFLEEKKKKGHPKTLDVEEVAANNVGSGNVDMNPDGKTFGFVRRDKRKKHDIESYYKRAKGTTKIKEASPNKSDST